MQSVNKCGERSEGQDETESCLTEGTESTGVVTFDWGVDLNETKIRADLDWKRR